MYNKYFFSRAMHLVIAIIWLLHSPNNVDISMATLYKNGENIGNESHASAVPEFVLYCAAIYFYVLRGAGCCVDLWAIWHLKFELAQKLFSTFNRWCNRMFHSILVIYLDILLIFCQYKTTSIYEGAGWSHSHYRYAERVWTWYF